MPKRVPSYRHHKASGQAFVEIKGHRYYLGKYESEESRETYHRYIAEYLASKAPPTKPTAEPEIELNVLLLAFWDFVKTRYVKNGKPTSERWLYRAAMRPMRKLYGRQPVSAFGVPQLLACRQALIDNGHCRTKVNQHVGRIRRVFRWGIPRGLVKPETWAALKALEGLRRGEAHDRPKVKPAVDAQIEAIKSYVSAPVWAMIQFELWTACRPGEVVLVRPIDITMTGDVWQYRPHSHKREHHELDRVILLGPHAQEILKPWLSTDLNAYCFSPRLARPDRQVATGPRCPGKRYTNQTYGRAIADACKKINELAAEDGSEIAPVNHWTPNQLRHTAATRIRNAYGIEMARIICGHKSAVTTEIYAEADLAKAVDVMRRLG
jgi:integrase